MRVCNNANTNWSRSDSSTSSAENEWSEKRRKDPLLGKRHLPHDFIIPFLLLVDREKRRFHSLVRRIKGRLLLSRSSGQCYVVAGNHLRRSLRSTTTYESGPSPSTLRTWDSTTNRTVLISKQQRTEERGRPPRTRRAAAARPPADG